MSGDGPALRLLDLVRHKLAAADARIEIGGMPPSDPRSIWVPIGAHRRVVAVFGDKPPEEARMKLGALVDAFSDSAEAPGSDGPAALIRRTLPTEIDVELAGLCVRAEALCAVLIDRSSPMVWGRSHPELGDDIDPFLQIAEALADEPDPLSILTQRNKWPAALQNAASDVATAHQVLVAALAIHEARATVADEPPHLGSVHRTTRRGKNCAFMIRSIAGVYLLALGFEGGFSEPRAEGVIQRATSHIERLIVSLPPTDPPPKPGRVVALRRPRT